MKKESILFKDNNEVIEMFEKRYWTKKKLIEVILAAKKEIEKRIEKDDAGECILKHWTQHRMNELEEMDKTTIVYNPYKCIAKRMYYKMYDYRGEIK